MCPPVSVFVSLLTCVRAYVRACLCDLRPLFFVGAIVAPLDTAQINTVVKLACVFSSFYIHALALLLFCVFYLYMKYTRQLPLAIPLLLSLPLHSCFEHLWHLKIARNPEREGEREKERERELVVRSAECASCVRFMCRLCANVLVAAYTTTLPCSTSD